MTQNKTSVEFIEELIKQADQIEEAKKGALECIETMTKALSQRVHNETSGSSIVNDNSLKVNTEYFLKYMITLKDFNTQAKTSKAQKVLKKLKVVLEDLE